MNWLLGTTLTFTLILAPNSEARIVGTTLPWSWPWTRERETGGATIFHPTPRVAMQRDHAVAEAQARSAWRKERIDLETRHRANLQNYVETRLALAEENARLQLIRENQLTEATAGQGYGAVAPTLNTLSAAAASAASAASAWSPGNERRANASPRPPLHQRMVEQAAYIAREVPRRTERVLSGDDELVTRNASYGLPKGLAVFMALLMLHVPSIALGSLLAGIFLIRRRRTRVGTVLVGVSAVLGTLIFYVIPW